MSRKEKISFEDYYRNIYTDRWDVLKQALLASSEHFCLSEGLSQPYYMDEASVAAARSLKAQPGDAVLDMCAAPGGKTLVIALALAGEGRLFSNDRSSDRRRRLKDVIENHLPEALKSVVSISGHDASRWGLFEQNTYDRILLDAPCSSEEHVLKSDYHLQRWSPSRTKQLAVQAHAMLAAALDAAKPGGTIVYSTCSLSPLENDGVIDKLLKKRSSLVCIEDPVCFSDCIQPLAGERTKWGIHILPDKNSGRGPIFICRMTKSTV